ncbi:MAG TPA: hypothetical protein VK154_01940 [Chitinophagales bacterium]|nr:hypothetical protein [Chitinophagales bacterium]
MFPFFLNPAYSENFNLPNGIVEVPKCIVQFQPWMGAPVKDTFGGRPILKVNDEPMFAEVAVMTHLANSGWQVRWLITKGRRNREPLSIAQWKDESYLKQEHLPIDEPQVAKVLAAVARANNNGYEGCWDLLAWMNGQLIFVLVKRNNKDFVTPAQNAWLQAALSLGLADENFMYVQWDLNPRCA